ncbi:MAG: hypothetical protein NT112_01110, partial [Methanoregula sp.]|nr:hypothetical protein [Methanoregula sp.]
SRVSPDARVITLISFNHRRFFFFGKQKENSGSALRSLRDATRIPWTQSASLPPFTPFIVLEKSLMRVMRR